MKFTKEYNEVITERVGPDNSIVTFIGSINFNIKVPKGMQINTKSVINELLVQIKANIHDVECWAFNKDDEQRVEPSSITVNFKTI